MRMQKFITKTSSLTDKSDQIQTPLGDNEDLSSDTTLSSADEYHCVTTSLCNDIKEWVCFKLLTLITFSIYQI